MRVVIAGGCSLMVCVWLMRTSTEESKGRASATSASSQVVHEMSAGVPAVSKLAGQSTRQGEAASDVSPGTGVVREWTGAADRRLGDLVPDVSHPEAVQFIPLRIGPEREVLMEVRRFREVAPGEGVFIGLVAGNAYSTAVFSYVGEAFAGFVTLYDERRSFQITASEDGLMRVTELDLDASPGCAPPLLPQNT
jgi:hypothetical protein